MMGNNESENTSPIGGLNPFGSSASNSSEATGTNATIKAEYTQPMISHDNVDTD